MILIIRVVFNDKVDNDKVNNILSATESLLSIMSDEKANVSKFERFVKACETAANAILPTLLSTQLGIPVSYVFPIMPIIVLVMEMLRQWLATPRPLAGVVISEDGRNGWYNHYYTYVSWYVANNVEGVNQIFVKYGYDESKSSNDKYIRTGAGTYWVDFEGAQIKTVCEIKTENGSNKNNIRLIHRDQTLLNRFVIHCQEKYEKRFKHDIHMYTYVSRRWESTGILNNKTPDYLFISDQLHREIFDDAVEFVASEEYYKRNCIAWKRGYLFYGTPGCGKTSTALAIAHHTGRTIYRIKLNQIISSSEFDKACRPVENNSIVILEELDTIALARSIRTLTTDPVRLHQLAIEYITINKVIAIDDMSQAYKDFVDLATGVKDQKAADTQWHGLLYWSNNKYFTIGDYDGPFSKLMFEHLEKTNPSLAVKYSDEVKNKGDSKIAGTLTLGDILTALDGNDCFYGCLIIITTNHPDRLDPALKRPGRVDMECDFKPANAEVIRAIYESYLRRSPPFVIPADATITQSRLIHQYILTYEKKPEVLDAKLMEYFNNGSKVDTGATDTTDIAPVIKSDSTTTLPIIPRSLAASFDLLNDYAAPLST